MAAANEPSASLPSQPTPTPESLGAAPTSTPVQGEGVEAGDERIPLAPIPQPEVKETSPEELAAEIAGLDRVLAALVLVFAFLLASFAVHNSDLWMHLAAGRLLAHGDYHFGADPFSYTSTGYWTNHNWLYDLAIYGLSALAGGPEAPAAGVVLVVFKALLVTLLAWVMLRIRRFGQSLWLPAVCTALALLAMSPRLLLQPTVVSFLFLATTLRILQTPRNDESLMPDERGRSPLAVYWLLPPLFALWANLDGWFILGPITVALFLLGQFLQQVVAPVRTGEDAPEPGHLQKLVVVLGIGVVACLLNPHHYHVFVLPPQLNPQAANVLGRDPILGPAFGSPFVGSSSAGARLDVAALSYFPLLLFGLLSFVVTFSSGWRWWRLTVWVPFAVLSALYDRTIPFFAVVGGPILALNLQDYVGAQFGAAPRVEHGWKLWSLGGRVATLLLGLILVAAAWPGWLHGSINSLYQAHRVAWTVEVDPSLKAAAQTLADWRARGVLRPGENGFNQLPDAANYCAWFCPEEKSFFDFRFQAFPRQVATEYVGIRAQFNPRSTADPDLSSQPVNWQEVFRRPGYAINHVIVDSTDPTAWIALLRDWGNWTLVALHGRTAIFRWNDPRRKVEGPFDKLPRYDVSALAFGPAPETAPATGRAQGPQPQGLWDRYLHGGERRSVDADLSAEYLDYFEQVRTHWPIPYLRALDFAAWSGVVGSLPATPAVATVTARVTATYPSLLIRLAISGMGNPDIFLRDKDLGPAAAPILAIRAARRAIAVSPDRPEGYLQLARAYTLIGPAQEEHWINRPGSGRELNLRRRIRQVQLTTSLEYCVRVDPDNFLAHQMLYSVYGGQNHLDLALDRLRDTIRLTRALGAAGSRTTDEFRDLLDRMQADYDKLEQEVKRRRDKLDADAREQGQPLFIKAQMALNQGLAKRSFEILQELDLTALQADELNFLVDLALQMGRPDEVQAALTEDWKGVRGYNYVGFRLVADCATGDYEDAGKLLDEMIGELSRQTADWGMGLVQRQMFNGLTFEQLRGLQVAASLSRQLADLYTLRGMVALEMGDTAAAGKAFGQALGLGNGPDFDFESRPIAFHYHDYIRKAGGLRETTPGR